MKRWMMVIAALALLFTATGSPRVSQAAGICVGAPAPRLTIGGQGIVLPGSANALRTLPGLSHTGSVVIFWIPAGGVFNVLSGPTCNDGYNWWLVKYNGITGWTPEGQFATYWLAPYSGSSTVVCAGDLPIRLHIGGTGVVTPGLPNVIRTQPNRYFYSYIIGTIPAGGVFSVIGGPVCGSGYTWWQVNYNGIIGWTPESSYYSYYVAPLS